VDIILLIAACVLGVAILLILLGSRSRTDYAREFAGLEAKLEVAEQHLATLRTQMETARIEQATATERGKGETIKSVGDEFARVQELLLKRLGEGHEVVHKRLGSVEEVLEKRLELIRAGTEEKLGQIEKTLQGNLTSTIEKNAETFARVDRHLTSLSGQTAQIVDYSRDLQKIHEILAAPKLRGSLGEFVLESMLADVLPKERYRLQWDLNGNKADAAVRTEEGWVCIDSKFPLENFRKALEESEEKPRASALAQFFRDVRNRIDEIRVKYIQPGVTLDFAFMFVPAENVFYELNSNLELAEYARSNRVIPVSPNTFFAYFATMAIGFRGLNISRQARQLEQTLVALSREFGLFREHYATLGRHVRNAFQKFQETETDVESFGRRLSGLSTNGQESLPEPQSMLPLEESDEDD